MVILIVEHQKSVEHSMQDAVSHSIHFGSAQPNTQTQHSTYGMSIIETIRTHMQSGNDEESQLQTSVSEAVVQGGRHEGVLAEIGKETVLVQ